MWLDSAQLAEVAARAAYEKKAGDVVVLDMRKLTTMTDYFLICEGDSMPHVRAISENVRERLKQAGAVFHRREGGLDSRWVLLDFGDVVAHVFHHAEREFYDLERLWGDAPRVDIPDGALQETHAGSQREQPAGLGASPPGRGGRRSRVESRLSSE